jgi:8-oxo-dGTP diphosphatase
MKERPKIGVSSMVLREGRVLLGKRRGSHGAGTWSTPGGHLGHGETVEECAKRELLEETGMIATSLMRGPYTSDLIKPKNLHYVTLYVFVKEFEGRPKVLEPHRCEKWEWFSWDHLPVPLFLPIITLIQEFGLESLKRLS